MNLDKKKFESQLPEAFHSLMNEAQSHGMELTLVGGAVRDFFLRGSLGKDWDIEVTHPTVAFNKDQWKLMGRNFSKIGRTSFLPYDIIRTEVNGYQFEFSPPRLEKFQENWQEQGHSNFTTEFDFKLPFEEAVKRRDFTINAIGVRINSAKDFEVLDPLDGLRHLSEKTLHHCGPDFQKDPVRFLRALRFAHKLNFELSPQLQYLLQTMPVNQFTHSYFWSEMQKSGDPIGFYKKVLEWSSTHQELKLPITDADKFLSRYEDLKKVMADPTRHESWLIGLEWVGLSNESWATYFSLSSESGRRLSRWAQTSKEFQNLNPESFHGEFEAIREKAEFEKLFDWYFTTKQLLQKNPELPLLKMIEEYLPAWIHLYRFEVVKDVKHIDPPFRAKYQVWNLCQRL